MLRCYLESPDWKGSELNLSPEEAHHIFNVMRAAVGDEVYAFDGKGNGARAVIVSSEPAILEIQDVVTESESGSTSITLIQALPKGSRMDLIVEKATELGAAQIIPVITDRVISRPKQEKVERWRRIAVAAAKQCGSLTVPKIEDIVSYDDALEVCGDQDILLIGSLEEGAKAMRDVIRGSGASKVAVIIGPEGDLTPEEHAAAVEKGAIPVSFGKLVLRVETAALYVLSALGYELG
ncbi:hypothetical protein BVX97_05600 [bacterium E08(2017)]|nr:hypothetical protein BVX97_05600 [bacterium E08(2017)]